jgi:membrane associated rhomboid family serine protease
MARTSPDAPPGADAGRPPLDPRAVATDLALVAVVPAVLVGVHLFLPPGVRDGLAFRHGVLAPSTFLTGAYVHLDDAHLWGNLTGYAIASLYAYGLAVQAGRRRWFRVTFLALVVVLPVPVHAASALAFDAVAPHLDPVSRGFSGVVGGFVGFVFVAFVGFVRSRYGRRRAVAAGAAVAILLLLEVDAIYRGVRRPTVALALVGAVVIAATARRTAAGSTTPREPAHPVGDGLVALLVVAVLAALVYNLFPPPGALVTDGGVTGVVAHAAGVLGGVVLAAALARAVDRGRLP